MERTASGHSIRPDPTERSASTQLLEDMEAAQRVRDHLATFRRRNPDSKHERILRSIINPRPRRHHPHHRHRHPHHHHHHHHHTRPHGSEPAAAEGEEYPLDNEALESIFSAANEIFFNGRLSQRVAWDWSHASAARFDSRVIGTTALRRAAATTRGFETLIVLSSTILRDAKYSRRLLISTFLHELIHCYLFICCGFRARCCGGHTDGFRDIAGVIEEWVGEGGGLYLSRVEADLELFRVGGPRDGGVGGGDERMEGESRDGRAANVYPCSGMAGEQEESVPAAAPSYGSRGVVHFVGDHADSCETGGGTPKVVYFGSGVAHASGTSNGTQEVVYFGRGVSPISRTSTPTREEVQYPEGRPAGGSGSRAMNRDSAWGRPRRALRPLYVYSGDETMAPYVYPNTMSQRP
ncbi:hypothetical protein NEMBOFW57_003320 [Staphylotrichum longicolle]|uniref:SprT-like domain-containing protein n=1 Tax=Staphylotrichum longicolle TaxID=669026 RepID=A0AAD4F5S6_9PEZI|nr:hypothetical protein NEMBOFW57_003320 [Staphylotrichum longicolle]